MGTYKANDFRKGLKVQIDGEPYLIVHYEFRKPGKGNALHICKMKNLIRGNTLERTLKSNDTLEEADVLETDVTFSYKTGDTFVFMHKETFENYELSADQIGDDWKYLTDGLECSVYLFNGNPVTLTPPNHVTLKVTYCEPGAKGDTATNVTKPLKVETGAEFIGPAFINEGDSIKIDTRTGDYIERVKS